MFKIYMIVKRTEKRSDYSITPFVLNGKKRDYLGLQGNSIIRMKKNEEEDYVGSLLLVPENLPGMYVPGDEREIDYRYLDLWSYYSGDKKVLHLNGGFFMYMNYLTVNNDLSIIREIIIKKDGEVTILGGRQPEDRYPLQGEERIGIWLSAMFPFYTDWDAIFEVFPFLKEKKEKWESRLDLSQCDGSRSWDPWDRAGV